MTQSDRISEWQVSKGKLGWRAMRQRRPGDAAGWEALLSTRGRVLCASGSLEQMLDQATYYATEAQARAAVAAYCQAEAEVQS